MEITIKDIRKEKISFAFKKIKEVKEIENKKFKGHIKTIPMYIYNNGLIATFAFIMKKSKNSEKENISSEKESYRRIRDIFVDYLKTDFNEYKNDFKEDKSLEEIIDKLIIRCDSKEYRRITLDILSILEWLVRFSDGMLKGEGDSNEKQENHI